MLVYVVVDDAQSPNFPLGDAVDVFIRRADAERFVEEVRGGTSPSSRRCHGSRSGSSKASAG
jgi:hypothetical protein